MIFFIALIALARAGNYETHTSSSVRSLTSRNGKTAVCSKSRHTFKPSENIQIKDLGQPQLFRTHDDSASRFCYETSKFGNDTHNIVVVHDNSDGTYEVFPSTRRKVADLLLQVRDKVCFTMPRGYSDVTKFRILGEPYQGPKWLSKPIVATEGTLPVCGGGVCSPVQNKVVRGKNADYMLPVGISTDSKTEAECEGTCCMWRFGVCDRRQPAWRRSCILLFDILVMLIHLFILYQLFSLGTCCFVCCQSDRIETQAQCHETHLAQQIGSTVEHNAVYSAHGWTQQNRPATVPGFKGLMTVDIV